MVHAWSTNTWKDEAEVYGFQASVDCGVEHCLKSNKWTDPCMYIYMYVYISGKWIYLQIWQILNRRW